MRNHDFLAQWFFNKVLFLWLLRSHYWFTRWPVGRQGIVASCTLNVVWNGSHLLDHSWSPYFWALLLPHSLTILKFSWLLLSLLRCARQTVVSHWASLSWSSVPTAFYNTTPIGWFYLPASCERLVASGDTAEKGASFWVISCLESTSWTSLRSDTTAYCCDWARCGCCLGSKDPAIRS